MEENNQNLPPVPRLPAPKKWYQHKGIITVIILAVVATLVVWTHFAYQPVQNVSPMVVHHAITPAQQPTITPSPTQTDTSNWQTYTSSQPEFGYSFQYPINWLLNPFGQDNNTSTVEVDEPNDDMGSSSISITETDSSIINNIAVGVTVLSNQTEVYNGLSWQVIITKDETSGEEFFNAITNTAADYYIVSSSNAADLATVRNHLLSTFQFLGPVAEQPALQQFPRGWKNYNSSRLGFSIDYPSDSFIPVDGLPQGDTYTVSFVNKDLSTGKIASSTTSYIEVDALPTSLFKPPINDDSPYSTTTLDGLPAMEGLGKDYTAEFVLIYKGTQYVIHIETLAGTTGADALSSADIEHIRQSFRLN